MTIQRELGSVGTSITIVFAVLDKTPEVTAASHALAYCENVVAEPAVPPAFQTPMLEERAAVVAAPFPKLNMKRARP
jgi:hypothetical protein